MATVNLALRFVVELVGVGALAYWGFQTSSPGLWRIVLTVGAPLALVVIWAIIVAPNADNALSQPQRDIIGTALLVLAAIALAAAGQPTASAVFGAIVVLNWVFLVILADDAAGATIRGIAGRGH